MTANNWALNFDKSQQDRVEFSTSLTIQNLSTLTLEGWVKVGTGATSSEQRAFAMRQGGGKKGIRLALTPYTGKLRFEMARADNTTDTNYTCDVVWDDYWHHVAFTADLGLAKEYKIYFDGALKQKGTIPDGGQSGGNDLKFSNTTSGSIRFGGWNPNNDSNYTYWDGKLDNIRLWNTVLDQSTIQAKMWDHILTPGTESGLIEEIRFNEGTGTSTAGAKNAGWTGTLKRAGSNSSALWTTDRPWMGDLAFDESAPANMTMTAHTSIGSNGFTCNWNSTTDNVYVQFYELTIATDAAFTSPVAGYSGLNVGLVNTKSITGLTPSTNYYARTRAVDAAGNASAYATYNSNAAITTTTMADLVAPTAPVQSTVTSISSSAFTANWGVATDNVAVTGYKIDVGDQADFSTMVSGYRNLDVGNVLTKLVNTNLIPLTSYWVRIRSYDAAGNESIDSNVIQITTAAPPDTIPPAIVVTQPPTSVASRTATANWNVGVDNVAVTGYRLDVATDIGFTSLVTPYNNLDVGNVLSYGLDSLIPSTGYWYRVRAYDAAGNVSSNTANPEQFITTPSSVLDGGVVLTTRDVTRDSYIWQTNASTNYGADTVMKVRGGGGDVSRGIIEFDISDLIGTINNANLRLYLEADTGDQLQLQRVTGTWVETTLTWTNSTLATTGGMVTFYGNGNNAWVEVDIASILPTTAGIYSFFLSKAGATAGEIRVQSLNSSNHPQLTLEVDPTNATSVDSLTLTPAPLQFTNYLKNPSAETGGSSFGGTTGILAAAGATLLQDATYAYDGTYSAKVVTTTTINDGVKFRSATGLGIPATGQQFVGRFSLFGTTNSALSAVLRITYTDASTSASPSTETVTNTPVLANSGWHVYTVSTTATTGKTIDYVEIIVYQPASGTSYTFWMDAATVVQSSYVATFDGSSSSDTKWTGTTHASSSQHSGVGITAVSTYLGDGNDNNASYLEYKRSTDTDWIRSRTVPTVSRSLKKYTATTQSLVPGNLVHNPSFAVDLSNWTPLNAATLTRITTDAMEPIGSLDYACLQVDTTASTSDGLLLNQPIPLISGEYVTYSFYVKSVSGSAALRMQIKILGATGTQLFSANFDFTATSEWVRYGTTSQLIMANARYFQISLIGQTGATRTFLVDHVQIEKPPEISQPLGNPYVDGTYVDTFWSGNAHKSETTRFVAHDVDYDVRYQYSDADGFDGVPVIGLGTHTPFLPDYVTSTSEIVVVPDDDRIYLEATYFGDDDGDNSALVQWKRADLSNWTTVTASIDRTNRKVYATIAGLYPGTAYSVQVTFTDSDGVYGLNPLTASTVTTTTSVGNDSTEYISFDGFVLSGPNSGDIAVRSHNAFDMPERRLQVEDMPRTDGAIQMSDWWGARTIKMEGIVKGASRSELFSNLEALRRALAAGKKNLVVDTLSSTNRHFIATCEAFECPEDGEENYLHLMWEAKFTCADPFRYADEETVEANLSLVDGSTIVITNDGDLSIDPQITISPFNPTAMTLTLVNDTTGERITPSSTFVTGDVISIDCARLSLRKNGVEIDYAGGYPRLAVGQNTLRLILSAGSVSMTVRRQHRYF